MIHAIESVFRHLATWGLPVLMVITGLIEFSLGLYENKWNKNERILDIVCFVVPKILIRPTVVYFTLLILPILLPGYKNAFGWVPFWWAFFIIAVADDLTQYWYHRLHHQVPWLWRFHRTHHSAPYMGMAMAGRQNIIYTIFFSHDISDGCAYLPGIGLRSVICYRNQISDNNCCPCKHQMGISRFISTKSFILLPGFWND
ncbi:MAG: sterol desaturase family protein [Bacteroidota bacterium]